MHRHFSGSVAAKSFVGIAELPRDATLKPLRRGRNALAGARLVSASSRGLTTERRVQDTLPAVRAGAGFSDSMSLDGRSPPQQKISRRGTTPVLGPWRECFPFLCALSMALSKKARGIRAIFESGGWRVVVLHRGGCSLAISSRATRSPENFAKVFGEFRPLFKGWSFRD
jgi:hypothetical protein